MSHRERKIYTPGQDRCQLRDHHQGQPQGHCPDLIKGGPKLTVINQEWTNINIVCHQSQCRILYLLIKIKSRPDVLNQRSISTNVIHRLVQNHSQDLVQGQGSARNSQWPNAPNFCLGSLEISKFWTLVAQIYFPGNDQ